MQATILLGTLKKSGLSNTEVLCEFLSERMRRQGMHCDIVKLVDYQILPGTCSDMGDGDQWPQLLTKVLAADIVILATPIWWANQSSLIQRVVERLDELHDKILAGEPSPLEGKIGGIVITGDSDGAQHIIGNLCNFLNAVGLLIPPYATLSVLWERQAKSARPTREELLGKYEADYGATADKMARQFLEFAPKLGCGVAASPVS